MLERGLVSRILFPVPPPSYDVDCFPFDLIWVPKNSDKRDDAISAPPLFEESVPCLLLTYPSARFLIIFFHSNAEDLGRCHGFCCYIRDQFQVHVLAVEYPGYGICPGTPSGETVMENALAAVRFATDTLRWPLDSIKVFGRSIGTGPAIALAALFSFAGVILVTPFLSVQELFRDRVGPFASLVEEWFANYDNAPKITSPTIIIHGQRDELIACRHGESIYELLRARKMLVSPPDMEHNTNLLTNLKFFVLPMFQFFALPDYVFQDLHVPPWAYDKRRSPYYVRPGVEISSHQLPTTPSKKQLTMPSGDNGCMPVAGEHEPVKKEQAAGKRLSLKKKVLGASAPGKHKVNRALAPLFTGKDAEAANADKEKPASRCISLGDDAAPEDTHAAAPVGGGTSTTTRQNPTAKKGDDIATSAGVFGRPSGSALANGKELANVSPEAREAIRRLEDFAGKLVSNEICSDELCVREERTEDEEKRRKRDRAAASKKSGVMDAGIIAEEVSNCPAVNIEPKQGFAVLGCGSNDSVWMRWCSKSVAVETGDAESEVLGQTRRPAPGLPPAGSVSSPRAISGAVSSALGPAAPRFPPCQAGEEVDTGIWEDWHNRRRQEPVRGDTVRQETTDDEAWHETSRQSTLDGQKARLGDQVMTPNRAPLESAGCPVKPPASKPAAPGREGKTILAAKPPVLFAPCCKPKPSDPFTSIQAPGTPVNGSKRERDEVLVGPSGPRSPCPLPPDECQPHHWSLEPTSPHGTEQSSGAGEMKTPRCAVARGTKFAI
mmetsp:Transcript_100269/g.189082  ORF Transcript_100269/g.189082 Transcript_100269/m.189082 type:complete len:778 (+) Transcript_100269:144-2477(+)